MTVELLYNKTKEVFGAMSRGKFVKIDPQGSAFVSPKQRQDLLKRFSADLTADLSDVVDSGKDPVVARLMDENASLKAELAKYKSQDRAMEERIEAAKSTAVEPTPEVDKKVKRVRRKSRRKKSVAEAA